MTEQTALPPTSITPAQLAARWQIHPKTLQVWRRQKRGPAWFKPPGSKRILYLLADIERIENRGTPVAEPATPVAPKLPPAPYDGP